MNKTKGQGKISGVFVHFWLIQRQVGPGPCMVQVWTVEGDGATAAKGHVASGGGG